MGGVDKPTGSFLHLGHRRVISLVLGNEPPVELPKKPQISVWQASTSAGPSFSSATWRTGVTDSM
jgi:hypothetical protein